MQVSYVGNFRHEFCTEVHLAGTLRNMGCNVHPLQEDELDVSTLVEQARDSDILLYTRTWGLSPPTKAILAFRQLEALGVRTISYHLDLYHGIRRAKTVDGDPFWATQYVFSPDGDPSAALWFKEMGINHFYIKPGVYAQACYRGDVSDSFASDVIFVGTVLGYHREWPYRQQLHQWLISNYGNRYKKYGHPECLVREQDLNNLYASAKVAVGDSLCPGFTKPYYWSDRVYETLGRGGFLIHPYVRGMEEEFVDGHHLRFYDFGDFEKLKQLIDYYIEHDGERQQIVDAGQAYVRQHCTYQHRLQQVLEIVV